MVFGPPYWLFKHLQFVRKINGSDSNFNH